MAGRPRSPRLAARPPLPAPSPSRLLLVPRAPRAPPPAARLSSLFPSHAAVASTGTSASTERRLPCSLLCLHARRPSSRLARASPPRWQPPARARHAASPHRPQPPRRPAPPPSSERLHLPCAALACCLPPGVTSRRPEAAPSSLAHLLQPAGPRQAAHPCTRCCMLLLVLRECFAVSLPKSLLCAVKTEESPSRSHEQLRPRQMNDYIVYSTTTTTCTTTSTYVDYFLYIVTPHVSKRFQQSR
ncbi:hypothetical protein BRADI_3g38006v3 [Brachypodium distachyon]|uniref:Uncharacterized protein n=1 Tax=Brachypodium distachyon TaxID=15368 RepID=A0A0Q3FG58_BRADI|nr:hypothetical protein BRADI_3g38006v3 [Brachypodium distachyon]